MIFLGDYQNCGRYGAEVWYTVLNILLNNDLNRVILLRGNHENRGNIKIHGFSRELSKKYEKDKRKPLKRKFLDFWNMLPVALFLGCGDYFIQCCHGGLEHKYNPGDFLEDVGAKILYEDVSQIDINSSGFVRGKFSTKPTKEGCSIDPRRLQDILKGHSGYSKVIGFVRGHQDSHYGCKMIPKNEVLSGFGTKGCSYSRPISWKRVYSDEHLPDLVGLDLYEGLLINRTYAKKPNS
jgi:hypothetical protein